MSAAHDLRADFDDDLGAPPRKPLAVTLAAVCWLLHALLQLAQVVVIGAVLLLAVGLANLGGAPANNGLASTEVWLGVFLALYTVAFLVFGALSVAAFVGRSPNLILSITLSGVAALGLPLVIAGWWVWETLISGSQQAYGATLLISLAHGFPALLGGILAAVGRRDYVRWKKSYVTVRVRPRPKAPPNPSTPSEPLPWETPAAPDEPVSWQFEDNQ